MGSLSQQVGQIPRPDLIQTPHNHNFNNHMKFYDPSADADGDGLPDPGQKPVFPVPPTTSIDVTSTDTCISLSALGFHP